MKFHIAQKHEHRSELTLKSFHDSKIVQVSPVIYFSQISIISITFQTQSLTWKKAALKLTTTFLSTFMPGTLLCSEFINRSIFKYDNIYEKDGFEFKINQLQSISIICFNDYS